MADLSLENLVNAVGDLSAPADYVPPRSGTFRTSKYPGFFGSASGATPSNNPNPLAGDAPEALPPTGVDPNAASASTASGLSSVTSTTPNLVGGATLDGGEGQANKNADAEANGKATGYDLNPDDALKAANIASAFTGPLGMAGLIAGTAAGALGVNPTGNPFDFKGNINTRPNYGALYDQGLRAAKRQGMQGEPAANAANVAANDAMTTRSSVPARFRDQISQDASADPTHTPAQGTVANSSAPVASAPAAATPETSSGYDHQGGPMGSNPAAPAAPAPGGIANANGGGGPGSGGGNATGNAPGMASHTTTGGGPTGHGMGTAYNKGGVVTMKPHHKAVARKNTIVMQEIAKRTGKTAGQIAAQQINHPGQLGAMARLHAKVAEMACGGKVQRKAAGGMMVDQGAAPAAPPPAQSSQYNPPPSATQGTTDTAPAMLTPGEMVVKKDAASQYSPEVLAALNDPTMAAQIDQLIEQFLGGSSGDGDGTDSEDGTDMASDSADDGDGTDAENAAEDAAEPRGTSSGVSSDMSGLGVMAKMRGVPPPKSKLSQITRAA